MVRAIRGLLTSWIAKAGGNHAVMALGLLVKIFRELFLPKSSSLVSWSICRCIFLFSRSCLELLERLFLSSVGDGERELDRTDNEELLFLLLRLDEL